MKVYIHYAEMDTWLVHITDGEPVVTADITLKSTILLLKALRDGSPTYCYILSASKSDLNLIRGTVNKAPYHPPTSFAFTLGEKFE